MILLRANPELRQTFEKLILTMKVPVKWNGLFAVIDNYIILQGEVRSLFFHFDSRKVVTNLIDLPVKKDEIVNTADNIRVRNVINMILYVFGKWGTIKGLRVEKSYAQLNQLFHGILLELAVEPEYTMEYFRFYKDGIRITYEDVVQTALETTEELLPETGEEEKGLWHRIVWKKARANFVRTDTELNERLKGRLGNNFYLVGYLCPVCREKMYMVVYPEKKEFRVETEEGGVLLARACACNHCNSFYTPRPRKLLSEGDVYTLQFEDDRKAYEDYLELLGRKGERVANHRFNEYADPKKNAAGEAEEESLDEICADLAECSDEEFEQITGQMEEGFYPDESIKRCEGTVRRERQQRLKTGKTKKSRKAEKTDGKETETEPQKRKQETEIREKAGYKDGLRERTKKTDTKDAESGKLREALERRDDTEGAEKRSENLIRKPETKPRGNDAEDAGTMPEQKVSPAEREEAQKKYEAKLQMCGRYSDRQLRELKSQLLKEKKLAPETKQEYLEQVEQGLVRERALQLGRKADSCEGKNYAVIKRVLEEVEAAELPQEVKQPLLEKLRLWKRQQGEAEIRQLMSKMPHGMDRGQYRNFIESLHAYDDVELSPYEEKLREAREAAEKQEISNAVRRARKNTRADLAELAAKLREGDFLPELVIPYLDKLEEKIKQTDEEAIAAICGEPAHMSFEEGMQAYEQIAEGEFLPELKTNALEMLKKRLAKIKTDESELLVKKLEEELREAGISENTRHHFYPARKVLLNQALPEETQVIDYAMACYAAGCRLFEYPVLVVDTSRNESGKEGIILTPDHLFYSTLLSAYGIPVASIDRVKASTGLLNKGLYIWQKNGTKTKVPYAVETKELPAFAEVLERFIRYLQEKPDSRSVNYLAKEKHEMICCFRCGYVYKGGNVCPKCGYKKNDSLK